MKNKKFSNSRSLRTVVAMALLTGAETIYAQTAWDGGGGDNDYSSALNWAGDIIPGNGNANGALIGSASTQTVVYNTATNYTSTGTAKANSLLVGTGAGGVGSLTLSGSAGTLTFGGDAYNNAAWIGSNNLNSNATGTVTVSAGKLAIGTGAGSDASINLGVSVGGTAIRNGTLVINGGTVEVGRRLLMGANATNSVGLLSISSGTLDMKRTGSNAEGDLGMIRLGTGTNTVNLDGGTLILTGFHTTSATNVRSNIYFNGTTLRANVANADFIAGTTVNANYQIKNGGLIMDTNAFAVGIADALSDFTGHNGQLIKVGTGTLTLSAANTYTGATTISAGTLSVGTTDNLGAAASNLVFDGGTLQITGTTLANFSGIGHAVTFNATKDVGLDINNVANIFTVDQVLNQTSGGFTKSGAGIAALNQANTYTGLTTIAAGTLRYDLNDAIASGAVTVNGGVLDLGIFSDTVGEVTLTAGSITGSGTLASTAGFTLNNAGATSVSAILDGNVGLTKTAVGTVTLSGANTYTGTTSINAGTLLFSGSGTAGSADSQLDINGGTFNLGGTTQTKSGVIRFLSGTTSNGTITKSGADYDAQAGIVSASLQGSVGLIKTTSATLTLSGANTFTGQLTVEEGSLSIPTINNASANGTLGNSASAVILGNASGTTGTLQYTGNNASSNKPFSLAAGGTGNFQVDTAGQTLTLSGLISGSGAFTKTGAARLSLSNAANNYTGNITVTAGTLLVTAGNNAINPVISALGNPQTAGRTITVGSGAFLTFAANDSMGNAAATPVVKIIVNGGTINNGNFFNTLGPVDLNGGTINAAGGANVTYPSFQLNGPINVIGSAASTISGSGTNSQMLLGSATLNNTSTTFNVADVTNSSASDLVVSAVLKNFNTNINGLIKDGVGTMTLSGTNTFTGVTSISAGMLVVNGSTTSNTTVLANATLGGSGTITGNVSGAGNVAPGNSIGTLTVAGTYNITGFQQFEVDAGLGALANSDQVIGITNLTYGGTLQVSANSGTFAAGDSWDLFSFVAWDGVSSFANNSDFGIPGGGGTLPSLGLGEAWNFDYTQGVLSVQAIPEPSTLLLGSFALLGFARLGLRRRRLAQAK